MRAFTVHTGIAAPLRRSDVDTDQIIPVRFLNHSARTGHAGSLFADWRADPEFVLNRPEYRNATILVAGNDFGTGSSREYAVWALLNYGFRAVVAPRFGDIFLGNALLNGLLAVTVAEDVVERLWELVERDPSTEVTVDLERTRVSCAGLTAPFGIGDRERTRLLSGTDVTDATLAREAEITEYERGRRPGLPTVRPA